VGRKGHFGHGFDPSHFTGRVVSGTRPLRFRASTDPKPFQHVLQEMKIRWWWRKGRWTGRQGGRGARFDRRSRRRAAAVLLAPLARAGRSRALSTRTRPDPCILPLCLSYTLADFGEERWIFTTHTSFRRLVLREKEDARARKLAVKEGKRNARGGKRARERERSANRAKQKARGRRESGETERWWTGGVGWM
jgi:hypothetical protein